MKLSGTIGIILRQVGGKSNYKSAVMLVFGLGFFMSFFSHNAYAEDRNINDDDITLAIVTDLAIDKLVSPEAVYVRTDRGFAVLY